MVPKAVKPMPTSASSRAPPAMPPNRTLYCSNLSVRLKKPVLRRLLYMFFSPYGPVLDVVVIKTDKMQGQAHVVFKDINVSTQAKRALEGFDFCGKPMRIEYAKGKSNIISKLDGTFKMPSTGATAPAQEVKSTELQKSIFAAPPSAVTTAPISVTDTESAQGLKRRREDESDEEEAPMEEEDDEGEAMDVSDED